MPSINPRFRLLNVRPWAALSVAVVAAQAVASGVAVGSASGSLFGRGSGPYLPPDAHVLSVVIGLGLLALTPRLWRGTRVAVPLTVGGLVGLAALSAATGRFGEAAIEVCLASLLVLGRGGFAMGCRNRPRMPMVCAAIAAWGAAYCALLAAPLVSGGAGHTLGRVLRHSLVHPLRIGSAARLNGDWTSVIEALVVCAALTSALALRSLVRPAAGVNRHFELEGRAARAIIERHGRDSLSPFVLRPDKALAFAAGGVLSYRLIGATAIVSSDPVAPEAAAPAVLERFMAVAHQRGWRVVVWGASGRHLEEYRRLGLRAVCAGEEAFVDPQKFTLEGRPVRKLRQSVNRVARRGWQVEVREGRQIDAALESEIDALEADWRARQRHLLGFAMGMGGFESEVRAGDLYVLARSPGGELGAVMRFVEHCGNLSLATMRRARETPNGLNEALVARALTVARDRGVGQVSLNYAGLAHLVRNQPARSRARRRLIRAAMAPLCARFQMERLVRFNDKFSPEWRPRYLVYESRATLPIAIARVLQAEGYLPERSVRDAPQSSRVLPRPLAGSPRAKEVG
jgi:lysyl-tRNA synthetase, class II